MEKFFFLLFLKKGGEFFFLPSHLHHGTDRHISGDEFYCDD